MWRTLPAEVPPHPQSAKPIYDEYTCETLPPDLVLKAKRDELAFSRKKGVWRTAPRSKTRGARVIGTRWACCNKGDKENPDIRCRLVCQEVNTYESDKFFAATPPLEALRLIVSLAAEDHRRQILLVDISRAYFRGKSSCDCLRRQDAAPRW